MKEVRSWVASPLGHNILLAMFKDTGGTLNHFLKKYASLKEKSEFSMITKGMITPNNRLECYLNTDDNMVNGILKQVESPRTAAVEWAKTYKEMYNSYMEKNIPDSAQLVLLNVSRFQSSWAKGNGNTLMKVYNSFSYTQDVHYEARILELPLRDKDFKLVVIAPNNVDLFHTLFRRLSHDGLRAAICNIQPVFTVESKLMAPQMHFKSEESYDIKLGKLGAATITQCGNTNVSDQGAQFNVMTYLYIKRYDKDPKIPEEWSSQHPPFFFGLVYQDTPVFTGQFNYIIS